MAKNMKAPGASGIKVIPNPGSTLQAVGTSKKHTNNTEVGQRAPADTTFSQHPGHGSAKRTMSEVGPTREYQN